MKTPRDSKLPAVRASASVARRKEAGPSERLYTEILARTSNTRKRRTLANIWTALEHLRGVRASEYTFASVAQAVDALKLGSPSYQTILNRPGKDYRALIEAYAREHGQAPSVRAAPIDDLAAGITDMKVRAQVERLVADNKSLRYRLDMLHSRLPQIFAEDVVATFAQPSGTRALPASTEAPRTVQAGEITISKTNSYAIRRFIENLDELDCHIDETSGALVHASGDQIAPPGFLQALRRLVPDL